MTAIRWVGILASMALMAQSPPPPPQEAGQLDWRPTEQYRAGGTEPFWNLYIDGKAMRYDFFGGPEVHVTGIIEGRWFSFNAWRYDGKTATGKKFSISIISAQCNDGMSEDYLEDSVVVTVDGDTVNGCGGKVVKPD